jgi:hypothetical protein
VLTPDQKGTIAEAAIVAQAVRHGLHVYRPVNDGLRWDILFGSDNAVLRVQCKWARRQGDVVVIYSRSCRRTKSGYQRRTYSRDDIDVLAAYCEKIDAVYLVPPEVFAGRPEVWLRVAPTGNNQQVGVRWAADFEFGQTLGAYAQRAIAQLEGRGPLPGQTPSTAVDSPNKAAQGGLFL